MRLTFENKEEDYKTLISTLLFDRNIIFNYNPNPTTEFTVSLVTDFKVVSSNHGTPNNSILVSIILRGTFWFKLDGDNHPEYLSEKLMINKQEAEALTEMLNRLIKGLNKYQENQKANLKL